MRNRLVLVSPVLVAVTVAAVVAAFVLSGPGSLGSPASGAPALQAAGDGCNSYAGGVCVVNAGDSEGGTDTWYCNSSFGWDSTNHCTTTINVGDTVRWENVGIIPHTATECAPPDGDGTPDQQGECNYVPPPKTPLFGAGILVPGASLEFTFNSPGTWLYYCYVHPLQPYGIIQVVAVPTPTPTKQPAGDTDGDGCSDVEENGPDASLGGQRDYLNPYDFYDVNGDLVVDLQDILEAIGDFGGSDPNLDRAGGVPKGPDGVVDLQDILEGIAQFGDSCVAPP